jgi:glutamate-1-semialdehyde 2,1-aminomutase
MKEMRKRVTPSFAESRRLQGRSHAVIPGGSHTYAKGDDQFPEQAPGFIDRGKGCHVWDVDGNEFIEYGMGLRSVTLGHAFEPVVEAAYKQMQLGVNFSRPARIEVDLAEAMLGLIDGAEMVKFAKNGSDVTTAAVKLARAYTGRNLIAVCGDQPFFSTDDWFIGSTEMNAGIPQAII